jgi:hypothetical protein
METIKKPIGQDVFYALLMWLSKEYSTEEANDQLTKAKIEWEDNLHDSVIVITYDNGVVDRVRMQSQRLWVVTKHLK